MSHRIRLAHRTLRIVLALGTVATPVVAHAQAASVSPQAVLVHERTRLGALTVLNPHAEPIEVQVDLRYGFVASDSASGRTLVRFVADSLAPANSAVPFLRVSPARFRLAPGASQVVRLAAVPGAALPDGEYWARIGVLGIPVREAAAAPADARALDVGVGIQVQTVLPVFFRKGTVTTGASIGVASARVTGDSLHVAPVVTRTGSGATIGALTIEALDAAGAVLGASTRQLAVYHTLTPRYALALAAEQAARVASVRLTLTARRPDLPDGLALPMTPVVASAPVTR
jgi:P pilus assembly chaperone PapD